MRRTLSNGALGGLGIGVLLMAWWGAVHTLSTDIPLVRQFSPVVAASALLDLLSSQEIWVHIGLSLKRVLVSLSLAMLVGVPIGLLVGHSARLSAIVSPSFQLLRMISPLSWMPIAVIAFGIGDAPVFFLLTFAAVWPVMLNTVAGVHAIEPKWLRLSASLTATRWETLRAIVLPAILPHVLTGTRLALGVVWIVLVPCEMLGVSAGLGYFILDTRDRLDYPALMATVFLIGLIGLVLDSTLKIVCQHWRSR